MLDFAADAGDFLFDAENVADFSGALLEDGLKTLLGFRRILQARYEIGMLLSNLLAILGFSFGGILWARP